MTLKARNTTLLFLNLFSILCLLSTLTLFIYSIANKTYDTHFGNSFFSLKDFSFINQSDKSVVIGLLSIQFYIPLASFFLYYNFEKTQSPLIILFSIFLFGLQLELAKLIIGLLGLRNNFSKFHLFLGNLNFLGNLISLFSFFLIAAYSKETQKLNIEIDIIVLISVCIFVTLYIPFNTIYSTKTFGLKPGYYNVIFLLFSLTILLTILTFILTYKETENIIYLKLIFSYILTLSGSFLATETNILLFIILGIIFLNCGTFYFYKFIHKLYSWD